MATWDMKIPFNFRDRKMAPYMGCKILIPEVSNGNVEPLSDMNHKILVASSRNPSLVPYAI